MTPTAHVMPLLTLRQVIGDTHRLLYVWSDAHEVVGKGTWYSFAFSTWSVSILQILAYEGSYMHIASSLTGQVLRGDQAFWDLVRHAANQR